MDNFCVRATACFAEVTLVMTGVVVSYSGATVNVHEDTAVVFGIAS